MKKQDKVEPINVNDVLMIAILVSLLVNCNDCLGDNVSESRIRQIARQECEK